MVSQVDIEKAKSIGGWMSDQELTWLAMNALERNKIVEFGSFHGRSTRALGDHTSGVVYAVDPWNGDYPLENGDALETVNTYVLPIFKENLKDLILLKKVIPVRGFSFTFIPPVPVDMVFIDGDHRYETVMKDINNALSFLKPGGIISGHDYGHPLWTGVKKAVDETFDSVEVIDSIWWTLKS
jgi:SAM-dependent methyltransferase